MSHLQLSLTDYQDETRWRWVLNDTEGNFLADHEVSLDRQEPLYQGFADLYTYVKTYTLPTYPMERVLEDVGEWMGQEVFGGLLEALSDEMDHPATVVQMRVPSEAQALLFRPFELAYLDGEEGPFAQCGIRFVYQLADGQAQGKKAKPGDELRVLAVFSLPSQASPLNLRRERYGLVQLVDQLRQTRGAAVTLRVIQYGATRQTLKDALRQGGGWDVIHLSGHGLSGQLMLEDEQGKPDIIQTDELAKLLRPTRRRVKLLTLSACLSGAGYNQARVMLGLESEQERTGSADAQSAQETGLPSLAQKLSQALGCAALAMRYPVGDTFATQLALELYGSLFNDQQSLPNALQIALSDALDAEYAENTPLSRLTPILFGTQATDLLLTPLPALGQHEVPTTGLLYFPEEPERFVGRVLPMLRASQALAPRSHIDGVLFYGMAGAGKTACALELAYRHETGRFLGYVWFKAPDDGYEISGTLGNFLQSIENQLNLSERGILTAHLNDSQNFCERTLPRLQAMLRQHATLIVIDNIESLLTKRGDWRDAKWEALLNALLTRTGASRLVLTSRRQPTALEQHPNLLRLSIHALSLGESVLLARELDHLRPLFGDETGRALLQRTLNMAQGHPKLLELADKMAADGKLAALTPTPLPNASPTARLRAAELGGIEGGHQRLDAFFRTGESQQSAEDFIATLRDWTTTLTATLSPTAHLLFHFLCRLEEEDRVSHIIEGNWEDFLKRLAPTPTPPPTSGEGLFAISTIAATALNLPNFGLNDALATLTNAGLIESRTLSGTTTAIRHFRIHPAIAETGRDQADAIVFSACDIELGAFWYAYAVHGVQTEMEGGTRRVVMGARRATPYLLRRERWKEAGTLLEHMIDRDETPATLAFALPLLRQIAAATQGTEWEALNKATLTFALLDAGRYAEAEPLLRDTIAQSVALGNYRLASVAAGQLGDLLRMMGRYDEALSAASQKVDYTRRAGLGPWSQLGNEAQRLQILNALGRYDEVLKQVNALRPQLATLQLGAANESANPWKVREVMLETGLSAAIGLEEWQSALDLNAENLKYKQKRGANDAEIARTRFNDYAPLLHLHRYPEARALLMHYRDVFERSHDIARVGKALGALADLEEVVGNRAAAVQFSLSALRYTYQAGEPEPCAIIHSNLANNLEQDGAAASLILAHGLAAGIIFFQTNSGNLHNLSVPNLAKSPMPTTPPTFDEVVATVELIEGVRFRELFARLSKRASNGDAAIAVVWEMALVRRAEREQEREAKMSETLRQFEPLLHAIAAVALGNYAQRAEIEAGMPQAEENGWQLTVAVRRIWAGERDADTLTAELDHVHTQLVQRILELIADLDAQREAKMSEILRQFEPWLRDIAAIALGNETRRVEIEAFLLQGEEKGSQLTAPVQRIWAGERDADTLTAGIDVRNARLVRRILVLITELEEEMSEILREFEPLLHAIAVVAQGNEASRAEIEAYLPELEGNGWQLTAPVQRIWAGERDADTLTAGIGANSARFVRRILELIADLEAQREAKMSEILRQFEPWLRDIAAIAQGNEAPRAEIEAFLPELEENGWQLTAPVQRIWAGEREADTLTAQLDDTDARLVRRILELIG